MTGHSIFQSGRVARLGVFCAFAALLGGCAEMEALRAKVDLQEQEIARLRKDNEEFKNAYYQINAEKTNTTGTLEDQVKVLQSQLEKEKALKSEREKKLEDELLKRNLEADGATEAAKTRSAQDAAEIQRLLGAYNTMNQDFEATKARAAELEAQAATNQTRMQELDAKLAELDSAAKAADAGKKTAEGALGGIQQERDAARAEAAGLKGQLEAAQKQSAELAAQIEQLKAAAGDPNAMAAAQQEAAKLKEEVAARDAKIAELEKQAAAPKAGPRKDPELEKAAAALAERLGGVENGKSIGIQNDDRGLRIIFPSDASFNKSSVIIAEAIKPALLAAAETLKALPGRRVRVEGHTDNQPMIDMPFADNWGLGAARADKIRQFLVGEGGIEPARMELVSKSFFDPLADNDSNEGRARNRRVEVVVGFPGSH